MKREEEIAKYCEDMGFPLGSCSSINSIKALTASDAIKWADGTMIDKACEYLKESLMDNRDNCGYAVVSSFDTITLDEFIEDFKKTMKGE